MDRTERREDKLFNFRPIFFFAVFFCLGIGFYYLYKFHDVSIWWLLCALPIAATSFFFCRGKERLVRTFLRVAFLALAFSVGAFAFSAQLDGYADTAYYNEKDYVAGVVTEKTAYGDVVKLVLDDVYIGDIAEDGKLDAYLPASFCENVELADEVFLYGKVKTDVAFFNSYGFRAEDIGEDIRFTLSGTEFCTVTGERFDICASVRAEMYEKVYAGMDETPAAISVAVLIGDTSGIEDGLYDNMRYGGIAHIFSVSGLNVGALYAFCLILIKKTPLRVLPNAARFLLLAVLLVFYTGLCGYTESVVRATVICLIAYASSLALLPTDFLESLGLSAIVVLLRSPASMFEVGCQLSFFACLGMAFLQKPIEQVCDEFCMKVRKRFPKKYTAAELAVLERGDTLPPKLAERARRSAVSCISVSLSAQIATSPILLNSYGYLSGWSLLLNFFFVPLISAGFAFLLAFVFIACLLPTAWASAVLYLPSVIWSALLLLFEAVDFSSFALTGITVSFGGSVCYCLGCTFLSDKWNLSKKWRRRFAAFCFAAFFATVLIVNLPV